MLPTSKQKPKILIVDDDASVRMLLAGLLADNCSCAIAESAEAAIELITSEQFEVVISDINLGRMSGLELLSKISAAWPDTVVLMISGNAAIDNAIGAIKGGAFDYIRKPFELEHVEMAVARAVDHHRLLVGKRAYDEDLANLVIKRTSELERLSYYDALTDLPNKTLFDDRVGQVIARTLGDRNAGVLLLSLNRFKEVRDTFGRSVGDAMLCELALRLKKCTDTDSTIARLDGDEFAILLPNTSTTHVVQTATRIIESLKASIAVKGSEMFATCGIGISLYPHDGTDAEGLIKNAGIALARANRRGKNNFQLYTEDMHAKAFKRLALENDLRRALERNELEIFYQPTVNATSRAIVGCEALLRWRHPELGIIAPARFIPLAEETGMIVEIGEWVLKGACAQAKAWHSSGFRIEVGVNLSVRQFGKKLPKTVERILGETGFDPTYLNLEITESSLMEDLPAAVAMLEELKKLGTRISIDDFGTGYSSLGYLKQLPVDVLKIDRSFIKDVTTNADDAALVSAVVSLAHNLRLNIVAEGVETEQQLWFLQTLDCEEWQGYLCSKPIPASQFYKLLSGRNVELPSIVPGGPPIFAQGILPRHSVRKL